MTLCLCMQPKGSTCTPLGPINVSLVGYVFFYTSASRIVNATSTSHTPPQYGKSKAKPHTLRPYVVLVLIVVLESKLARVACLLCHGTRCPLWCWLYSSKSLHCWLVMKNHNVAKASVHTLWLVQLYHTHMACSKSYKFFSACTPSPQCVYLT